MESLRYASLRAVAGNEAAQEQAAKLALEGYQSLMKQIAEHAVRDANRIGLDVRWRNAGIGWVL